MSEKLKKNSKDVARPFPADIRFHSGLSWGEKAFLAEIISMTKNGKYPSLSSRYLSTYFGVSHQTIINWIKKLTRMDLLEVECNYCDPEKKFVLKSKNL